MQLLNNIKAWTNYTSQKNACLNTWGWSQVSRIILPTCGLHSMWPAHLQTFFTHFFSILSSSSMWIVPLYSFFILLMMIWYSEMLSSISITCSSFATISSLNHCQHFLSPFVFSRQLAASDFSFSTTWLEQLAAFLHEFTSDTNSLEPLIHQKVSEWSCFVWLLLL